MKKRSAGSTAKAGPQVEKIAARKQGPPPVQLVQAMKRRNISKSQIANFLRTSRSQVDRILDPHSDVTLSSLQRAAALLGKTVVVRLV
jgi:antitoxin component HigA of HigAB toxin-antitoxin module